MSVDKTLAVVGCLLEGLREFFVDQTPLGGRSGRPQHRGGINVPIDGLTGEGCEAVVWANVLRRFRTREFPNEALDSAPCAGSRAVVVQVGAARCAVGFDDAGYPPTPDELEREALVVLDDANRLEWAVCRATQLADDRELISGSALGAWEPVGPEGGIVAGVLTVTYQLL